MCDTISIMGMVLHIKPESSTVRNSEGNQPWHEMIDSHMGGREAFTSEYYWRSIRVSLCRTPKDVRRLHSVPQVGHQDNGDLNLRHMLQH